MRSAFALISLVAVLPLTAQSSDPLAFLHRDREAADRPLTSTLEQVYTPVRSGEVQSAGYLTEFRSLPFGRVLGPTDQPVVHSTLNGEAAVPGSILGILPPAGVSYRRGDTVTLALVVQGPKGWGDIIVPTGLARIGDQTPRQTLATVITMFGPIRAGQVVLPLEPYTNPGHVQPVAAAGPVGEIVIGQEPRELEQVGGFMFINIGRTAGMHIGDFVQVRRRPAPRPNASDAIDDLMAVAEVVHVGEKSSTIKFTRIIDPSIRPGTPVVRIATLPG